MLLKDGGKDIKGVRIMTNGDQGTESLGEGRELWEQKNRSK